MSIPEIVGSVSDGRNCEGASCSSLAVTQIQLRLDKDTILTFWVCESCKRDFQKLQTFNSLNQVTGIRNVT